MNEIYEFGRFCAEYWKEIVVVAVVKVGLVTTYIVYRGSRQNREKIRTSDLEKHLEDL